MACSPSPSPLHAAASPHGFQQLHPLITSLAARGRCAPPGLCGQTFPQQRATGPLGGSPVSCPSRRCWCLDTVTQCLLSSWWLLAARGVVWHQLSITATSCSPSFMKGVCLSAEQTFAASRCELYTLCRCQLWAQSVRVLPGPQGGPRLSHLLAPGVSWPVILLVSLTFTAHIWL